MAFRSHWLGVSSKGASVHVTSEAGRRAWTAHSIIQVCLLAPADAGVGYVGRRRRCRVGEPTPAHKYQISLKKNNNNETFQTYIVSGKSPGEMSRQTTRTFTFKIEVQIPSTCPSTATCAPILHADNVLGVYNIQRFHLLVLVPSSLEA